MWGDAGYANSKLYVGQATKNVLMDCSTEPVGALWDGKMAKTRNIGMKHIQT